jgi:WXG100 family type VII secretion target
MARILVTPEEIRDVAGQFKQKSDDSSAMVQSLTATVNKLDAGWDGLSSQKFMGDFQNWQKGMQQYVVQLDEIHNVLMNIAQRFEEADKPV